MRNEQEEVLLSAFRNMHHEDRELLVDLAIQRALKQVKKMPKLSLVVDNPLPASVAALRSRSS